MTEKRFHFGYVCGDKGLVTPNDEWVIENVNSVTDLEKNWDTVLELLNTFYKENEQLKSDNKQYEILVKSLKDENQKLKLRLKDLGVEYY